MFRRVAKGMFPMSKGRGPISTPWASRGQACSAVPQVARKERQSLPSSSMASISRCCIPSACDCWMEWACSAQQDPAFLISVVQWVSASVIMEAQLASASQIQVVWWASTSNGCYTMGLCLPNGLSGLSLVLMKGCLKVETCFLRQASREDLVISRHPIALFISSWSKITFLGRALESVPEVLAGGVVGAQTTSAVWSIGSVISGVTACSDA